MQPSNSNGIINTNDANIQIPHTLKIIFLILFSFVTSPFVLVNKNKELKDNNPKNTIAQTICKTWLNSVFNWKVPTLSNAELSQGNRQMPKPNNPAKLQTIASHLL